MHGLGSVPDMDGSGCKLLEILGVYMLKSSSATLPAAHTTALLPVLVTYAAACCRQEQEAYIGTSARARAWSSCCLMSRASTVSPIDGHDVLAPAD